MMKKAPRWDLRLNARLENDVTDTLEFALKPSLWG
jgi:hypothetical protein